MLDCNVITFKTYTNKIKFGIRNSRDVLFHDISGEGKVTNFSNIDHRLETKPTKKIIDSKIDFTIGNKKELDEFTDTLSEYPSEKTNFFSSLYKKFVNLCNELESLTNISIMYR